MLPVSRSSHGAQAVVPLSLMSELGLRELWPWQLWCTGPPFPLLDQVCQVLPSAPCSASILPRHPWAPISSSSLPSALSPTVFQGSSSRPFPRFVRHVTAFPLQLLLLSWVPGVLGADLQSCHFSPNGFCLCSCSPAFFALTVSSHPLSSEPFVFCS